MAAGGYRPNAGRKVGSRSKDSVERELLAERIMAEQAQKPGRKLAKEVLDDFMHLFMGLAAQHQPLPPGVVDPSGAVRDEEKFVRYATMAGDFAGKLVKFQSPTYGMIKVSLDQRFPNPGADGGPDLVPPVPGQVQELTASQAYRLLRDMDVIENDQPAPKARKAKNAA